MFNEFCRVFNNLFECICFISSTNFIRVIKTVQLFEVCFICFLKIPFYICKINDITIMVFFIWSVDSCNCLQQIMVFQFSTKIQAFQSWCIKSGKKHIENDKNINCHIIFEVINNLISCIFVITIVKYKSSSQMTFHRNIFIKFRLNFIKICKQLPCLLTCFTNDHTAERIISLNLSKSL